MFANIIKTLSGFIEESAGTNYLIILPPMENVGKKAFITGGTGLVGSHLLFSLLTSGKRVKAAIRGTSDTGKIRTVFGYYSDQADKLFNMIEFVECNLENCRELNNILSDCDCVYHCAATVSFKNSKSDEIVQNNMSVTRSVVDAALSSGIRKMCHVSSVAALAPGYGNEIITELDYNNSAMSKSAYAKSKYLSEEEVWRGIRNGLNAVIINPTVILGPGNWKSGSSQYFSVISRRMPFYTTGITGYVDVRDVVKSMVLLMDSDISGERFIISSENLSFREVFSMIAVNLKKGKPFIRIYENYAKRGITIISFLYSVVGKRAPFDKSALKPAFGKQYYSNEKIIRATGITFTPISIAIRDTALLFLKEQAAR